MRARVLVSHAAWEDAPRAEAIPAGAKAMVQFGPVDFLVDDMAAADHLAAALNRVYATPKQEAA